MCCYRFDYADCVTKELALQHCPYCLIEGHPIWNNALVQQPWLRFQRTVQQLRVLLNPKHPLFRVLPYAELLTHLQDHCPCPLHPNQLLLTKSAWDFITREQEAHLERGQTGKYIAPGGIECPVMIWITNSTRTPTNHYFFSPRTNQPWPQYQDHQWRRRTFWTCPQTTWHGCSKDHCQACWNEGQAPRRLLWEEWRHHALADGHESLFHHEWRNLPQWETCDNGLTQQDE